MRMSQCHGPAMHVHVMMGVVTMANINTVFVILVGCTTQFEAYTSQFFARFNGFHLDIKIW